MKTIKIKIGATNTVSPAFTDPLYSVRTPPSPPLKSSPASSPLLGRYAESYFSTRTGSTDAVCSFYLQEEKNQSRTYICFNNNKKSSAHEYDIQLCSLLKHLEVYSFGVCNNNVPDIVIRTLSPSSTSIC